MTAVPPELAKPGSRFNTRPLPNEGGPPTNTQTFASSQSDINLLIYLRNINNEGLPAKMKVRDDIDVTDTLKEAAIGQEFTNPERFIFGNDDARELLSEFNAAIDFVKRADPGMFTQKFQDFFKDPAVPGMPTKTYLDISAKMCLEFLKVRMRNLDYNIYHDFNIFLRRQYMANFRSRRAMVNNDVVHGMRLEEDAIWAGVFPHFDLNTGGTDPRVVPFRRMHDYSRVAFSLAYRVTVNEALVLLKFATSRDDQGDRTARNYLCSQIIGIINIYSQYRLQRLGQLFSGNGGRDSLQTRADKWESAGGNRNDNAYEMFLKTAFRLVHAHQYDTPIPRSAMDAYRRDVTELATAVGQDTFAENGTDYARVARNLGIQENIRVDDEYPEPQVIVDLDAYPTTAIPSPRESVNPNTAFTTMRRATDTAENRREMMTDDEADAADQGRGGADRWNANRRWGRGARVGTGAQATNWRQPAAANVARAARWDDDSPIEDDGKVKRGDKSAGQAGQKKAASIWGKPIIRVPKRKAPDSSARPFGKRLRPQMVRV
ncbi:hypothetical protein F4818DRAFT_76768 [Hypoxylon cercidicola]|nr:hypothetical protein F4818DRAFT_76768 [Hypoxylon cercidicola]